MSYNKDRALNALLGAFTADAAALPLHWIYKDEELNEKIKDCKATPEFFPEPSCPFYGPKDFPGHYSVGEPSPYGEEAMILLEYMAGAKGQGDFDKMDFQAALVEWEKAYTGRRNKCTKEFAENIAKNGAESWPNGASDFEANAYVKSVILCVRYAGQPELLDKVEQAVRTHQDHDGSVQYALAMAKMIEAVILGSSVEEAMKSSWREAEPDSTPEKINTWMELGISLKDKPNEETVSLVSSKLPPPPPYIPEEFAPLLSKACAYPQAATVVMKVIADSAAIEDPAERFKNAVRQNILIGGDSVSRAIAAGALFAADAPGGVPEDWAKKVKGYEQIKKLGEVLVAKRA